MARTDTPEAESRAALSKIELIGLTASVMALTALTIDMMLAALGDISEAFRLTNENDRQLVVTVFLLSSGAAQLFYGPISDRFGRRTVFIWSISGFIAATLLCVVAAHYSLFLAGRALQGVAAAGGRVVVLALVRDLFKGREMASIMSMAMTVGMISPIIAPGIGQLIMFVAPWRYVFVVLFAYGVIQLAWVVWRLPETLAPEDRQPLRLGAISGRLHFFFSHRVAIGYTFGAACVMGTLMAYITAAQQVYVETYGLGAKFPLALGSAALAVGAAAMLNSRLVRRVGTRRLSHSALAAFALIHAAHAIYLSLTGGGTIAGFMLFIIPAFFAMGLINANFSAIVMEPMGNMAGTASSVYGFATMTGSSLLGGFAARFYDGTAIPIVIAFALFGFAALGAVFLTERGRLFYEEPHA